MGEYAIQRKVVVRLRVQELRESQGSSVLLAALVTCLADLENNMGTGDPEYLHSLLAKIPHGLRTQDVVTAQHRLQHLLIIEKRVREALVKIETGLLASGTE